MKKKILDFGDDDDAYIRYEREMSRQILEFLAAEKAAEQTVSETSPKNGHS